MKESDCLSYCYARGFTWEEDAGAGRIRLYDVLDRVSCWCCANKSLKELRNIKRFLPGYWKKLEVLEVQFKTNDRSLQGERNGLMNKRKRKKTWKGALVKYILLTVTGIALFKIGADAAYTERGYRAIGGEGFAVLLPMIYLVVSRTVKDFVQDLRGITENEPKVKRRAGGERWRRGQVGGE